MTNSTQVTRDPRLTIALPQDLHDKLLDAARASDRSAGAELRVALRKHLDTRKST